jgi:hypothetical protein
MKKLILMRGLPGGGKSTYARQRAMSTLSEGFPGVVICSTDDQFINDKGEYVFDPTLLGVNHQANQLKVLRSMIAGIKIVIVDNTNTTHKEMKPYKDMAATHGYEVEEVLIGREQLFPGMDGSPHALADYIDMCAKRNTHKVPREAILKMARRFEE